LCYFVCAGQQVSDEETVSTSTTKTDALLAQVDDLDLSELCRTINEPSDLGDENIDETVSANTRAPSSDPYMLK
jgi:hypothetical protein